MLKTNEILNQSYEEIKHPSGLTIFLYPMKEYEGTHVQFGTHFGSIDMGFQTKEDKEFYLPPYGVAHFLEHKMFEQEYGDAFERFGYTGANANAYTTFDRTVYLFHCTDRLNESLEILLQFVTTPYFTKEGVDKEQGIIAQEIGGFEDKPGTQVFFSLLRCLYHNHPVKVDIIGTVESISHITPEVLYKCYNTFYNLNNMALSVVGKFSRDEVLALCDKHLKKAEDIGLVRKEIEEPEEIVKPREEIKFPVSMPLFEIGYKEVPMKEGEDNFKIINQLDLILEYLAGHTSRFYNDLYKKGLINSSFDYEVFEGKGYLSILFGGESKDPEAVFRALVKEIETVKQNGLNKQQFEIVKKAIYGENIRSFESASNLADTLLVNHFTGQELFDSIDKIKHITFEETNELLQKILHQEKAAMSVVRGN